MGIKSFQGPRNPKEKHIDDTPFKVKDYMSTTLTTFSPNQSIEEVIEILIHKRISGGPVVNDKNELVGIISEGDCIKQISESRYYNMPMGHSPIEKHMIKEVQTIDGNMNIFDAAKQFLEARRRRFPIVENGKLIGLISQKDILKAAMKLKGEQWSK
ncbi:CBS domain-containing protein [Mangrovimonas aestuarii]|uniref:CBS domain-containing protein n=1 Tax=Mangrovimonas aestuarii TaxID=3018443 RepID=UPI00237984E6|nr:CBS domain-containing protein [Mangrovimonas aestuarii]